MESGKTAQIATKQNVCELVRGKRLKQLELFGGGKALTKLLGSDTKTGLPEDFDYEKRRREFGKNFVPPPREQWYYELLLAALNDTTIWMLLAASFISLILGLGVEKDFSHGWIEGVSILVSVLVVINVQAATDYTKAKEFRRQQMQLENQQVTQVLRAGKSLAISPRELVVGDMIRFAVGDIIPVDCVLIEGSDVKIDESALTGETKLVKKYPFSVSLQESTSGVQSSTPIISRVEKKELFESVDPFIVSGTNVMSGSGLALVVAVGEDSVQGAILAAVGKTVSKTKKSETKKLVKVNESDKKNVTKSPDIEDKANENTDIESHQLRSKKENPLKSNLVENDLIGLDIDYDALNDGGTLVEKLDNFAILIGKIGGSIALITLIAMLLKFAVIEFARDKDCKDFSTELSCNSAIEDICLWKSKNSQCVRQWVTGRDLEELLSFLITAITILVVVVPEGLPLAVTLSLAVSMKRMTHDNNQVKHMDACETMGSATTICSDKTGTLTINKMTVVRCAVGNSLTDFVQSPGSAISFGETILSKILEQDNKSSAITKVNSQAVWDILSLIAYNGMLNSAATSVVKFKKLDEEMPVSQREYIYQGNATECALLKLAIQLGFNVDSTRKNDLFIDLHGYCNDWGTFMIPFSSERKRMSIVVPLKGNKKYKYRVYSKGASTYILDACSHIASTDLETHTLKTVDTSVKLAFNPEINLVHQLTPDIRNNVLSKIGEFQRESLRVIGLAYKDLEDQPLDGWRSLKEDSQVDNKMPSDIEMGMTFLGIVGIEDPLRPEILDAIKQCASAGVDVRMCTGGALETAVSIAVKSGILKPEHTFKETLPNGGSITVAKPDFAMVGAEFLERVVDLDITKPKILRQVYDFEKKEVVERNEYPFKVSTDNALVINQIKMDSIWPKLRVLARCQPQDKLILVRGLRNSKVYENLSYREQLKRDYNIEIFNDRQVVAVTGDGTNDAPALKEADVGFAMGITGTETAKQASDILLLDDNFLSIVKAIMWGRNVYQAISKFVQFQLTVNVSAVTLAVLGALILGSSPLQPVQMLWVNLIMDSLASLALATDPPHKHLLLRPPYGRRRKILSEVMIFNIVGQSCYQLIILFAILFAPQIIPGNVEDNKEFEGTRDFEEQLGSVHWTVFFNTFVMMQLFNEFNSRKIQDVTRLRTTWKEWNVFGQISENKIFMVISVTTFVLQVLIVQFGGAFFTLSRGGISFKQWGFCFFLGFLSLVWQFLVVNPLICAFGHPEDTFEIPIPVAKEVSQLGSTGRSVRSAFKSQESAVSSRNLQLRKEHWNRLLKNIRGGFNYSRALNLEVEQGIHLKQVTLLSRGQNRPLYSYSMTKQESLKFDELMNSYGRKLLRKYREERVKPSEENRIQ